MDFLPIGANFEPKAGQPSLLEESRLTEGDFLKVLVAQLRNQNPLEPQSDAEFISQLAQFDQLISLNSLNDTMSGFAGLSQISQASGLIGREVLAYPPGAEQPVVGVVSGVEFADDQPMLVVDGALIPVAAVAQIRDASGG